MVFLKWWCVLTSFVTELGEVCAIPRETSDILLCIRSNFHKFLMNCILVSYNIPHLQRRDVMLLPLTC